jgi:hypothetical protein
VGSTDCQQSCPRPTATAGEIVILRGYQSPGGIGLRRDRLRHPYIHAEIVRLLLAAGADAMVRNAKGVTALEYAQRCKHREVADVLATWPNPSEK